MRKLFYLSLVVGIGLASCSKDTGVNAKDPSKSTATSMQEVEIPAGFDWRTDHMVTITMEAAPVYYSQPEQVKVKNAEGKLLATFTAKMTETTSVSFELAKSVKTVTVECGSIVREVNVSGGSGVFSYIDEADETTNDSEVPQFDEKELESFNEPLD